MAAAGGAGYQDAKLYIWGIFEKYVLPTAGSVLGTMEVFWKIMKWSFEALASGKFPLMDWRGQPWPLGSKDALSQRMRKSQRIREATKDQDQGGEAVQGQQERDRRHMARDQGRTVGAQGGEEPEGEGPAPLRLMTGVCKRQSLRCYGKR